MGVNTYYLELTSILLNVFQSQKLMNKTMKAEKLFKKKQKKQEALEKKLGCKLLELIQVMQKRVLIQIMKLVK